MLESNLELIVQAYFFAKRYIIKHGYSYEIDWQGNRDLDNMKKSDIIREAAWVILSAGLSYNVVNKKFPEISEAFYNWSKPNKVIKHKKFVRNEALKIFHNERKIEAILSFIDFINTETVRKFKEKISEEGDFYLHNLPFFGPATSLHLTKNIGLAVSKPDRHLNRISAKLGFKSPDKLCTTLSEKVYEKKSVIDLVIWRYASLDRSYLSKLDKYLTKHQYTYQTNKPRSDKNTLEVN